MQYNEMYFYTASIYQWRPLLKVYHFEPIILQSLSYLHHKKCIKVFGFVIMPNHLHLIWEMKNKNGKESPAASLMKFTAHQFEKRLRLIAPSVLEQYKVDNTSRLYNFWQPDPDWFLLDRTSTIDQKLHYIHTNPLQEKWNLVKQPSEYNFSSARFYEHSINAFDFLYDYRDWY